MKEKKEEKKESFFPIKKEYICMCVCVCVCVCERINSGMLLAPIRSFGVCISHQSVVFVLWFERCSNFNEVMGDSERVVRKIESSFRKRNVSFSVFLTCILPRFMRNAIPLDGLKISDYL